TCVDVVVMYLGEDIVMSIKRNLFITPKSNQAVPSNNQESTINQWATKRQSKGNQTGCLG
ncbi:TPA: hypothetical protein ACT2DY_001867, partial [Pasteurella multocida]